MSRDIYNVKPVFGGSFSADEVSMTFTGANNSSLGTLIQGVNARYSRPVQRIFELGNAKRTYYIVGRAEGGMSIQQVAAPRPVNQAFIHRYTDVCNVPTNFINMSLDAGSNCAEDVPLRWGFSHCMIVNYGVAISVQAITLQEQLDIMFTSAQMGN